MSTNKQSKPFQVLELARNQNMNDNQIMELLQVNPSTYYTLKSRLNSKVATILSKKVDNPIGVLLEEVTRVPATIYGDNKSIAIRALKELEKQLIEYDLSNELITVYKAISRLKMYSPEYDQYSKLYNKYVAFSLASSKAEFLFYDFLKTAGEFGLSSSGEDSENMQNLLREMSNISELYESHRLSVYFNISRIYYLLLTYKSIESLQNKEMEIDQTLQEIKATFDKYELDTFYSNLKFIVDCLYTEYYIKIGNLVRAKYYYNPANAQIVDIASQHIQAYHVTQFLDAKVKMYMDTDDLNYLTDNLVELQSVYEVDAEEIFHYVNLQKYLSIVKFYEGDYSASALILNKLKNKMNLKSYTYIDMDLKMFQALQYAILNNGDLCLQITNSISRNVREDKDSHLPVKFAIKMVKTILKEGMDKSKRVNKVKALLKEAQTSTANDAGILTYIKLNDEVLYKMGNK